MKRFRPSVTDLECESDGDVLFEDFAGQFSREDLFLAAEWYVRERLPNSSVYSFRDGGGLMKFVVGLIIFQALDSRAAGLFPVLVDRLVGHYGFTSESVPPRLLVREAVAHRVRLAAVLADLERELIALRGQGVDRSSLVREIGMVSSELANSEDAFLLSDEVVDGIIQRIG